MSRDISSLAYDAQRALLAVSVTASSGEERVDVLSVAGAPELVKIVPSLQGSARVQCLTRAGQLIYATSRHFVRCDLDGDQQEALPIETPGQVRELPDGRLLFSGYQLRLWDGGASVSTLADKIPDLTHDVGVSPDGRFACSVESGPYVRLWDLASGAQVRRLTLRGGVMCRAAFSPDGTTLVCGSENTKGVASAMRLFNVDKKWSERTALALQSGALVRRICFSADGERLCIAQHDHDYPYAERDGEVSVWDWRAGECLHTIRIPRGAAGNIPAQVALSADGRQTFVFVCPEARVLVFETP